MSDIKKLVNKGQLETAIERFRVQHFHDINHDQKRLLNSIEMRFNVLKNKMAKGILSEVDSTLERNQIADSFVDLIDRVDRTRFSFGDIENESDKVFHDRRPLKLVLKFSIAIIITGGSGYLIWLFPQALVVLLVILVIGILIYQN